MQSGITVSGGKITGTLKYLDSGTLATDWGAGHFMALKFTDPDENATSIKVGLYPTQGSDLVELDSDMDGVFKVTDKAAQKFVVVTRTADDVKREEYDLSELVLESAED